MAIKMADKMGCQYQYPHNVFVDKHRNTNPYVNYNIFPIEMNLRNNAKMGNEGNNSLIIVIAMKNPRWRPK